MGYSLTDIKTILLDMDGVLVDLRFANFFWNEFLPQHYAEKNGSNRAETDPELFRRYAEVKGSLQWYSLDYWSEQLQVDIPALKRSQSHLIALRAGARDFLSHLRQRRISCFLLSNAHPFSIDLKLQKTGIKACFDTICSTHQLGLAKEQSGFWELFAKNYPLKPESTLFIDDNEAVLNNARRIPFAGLYTVLNPDSGRSPRSDSSFPDAENFSNFITAES